MIGFWIWIILAVLAIIGLSVVAGRSLSRPRRGAGDSSRHQQVTALKMSGALKHRKSNRD